MAADLEARAVRHTLACLLARVVGRSPLEYLDAAERIAAARCGARIIPRAPATIADLIDNFTSRLCLPSNG